MALRSFLTSTNKQHTTSVEIEPEQYNNYRGGYPSVQFQAVQRTYQTYVLELLESWLRVLPKPLDLLPELAQRTGI